MFDDLATTDINSTPAKGNDEPRHECEKCSGTGQVRFGYMTVRTGKCFKCNGTGYFKTSYQERVTARHQAKERKQRKAAGRWELFAEQNPVAAEWLQARQERSNFARSLKGAIEKYGRLTERQMAAVMKCVADDADRAQKREQAAEQLDVDLTDLLRRFGLAKDAGLKRPKIILSGVMFSLAPENGKNAGCIYVKGDRDDWGERPYLGKITPEGWLYPSRDCTDEQKAQVMSFGQDVIGNAKAHGAQHGNCCFCNRDLTTDESVSNGYGPICAERYGLPWEVSEEFKAAKAALKAANEEAAA